MMEFLDRIGRPLLRLVGVAFACVVVWFFIRIMSAIVYAFDKAAETGQSVPDMSGGMSGIISAMAVAIPAVGAFIVDQFTRHRERMDQQARGTAPNRPFPPSAPSAPPSPPDLEGPRPWQNRE